MKASENKSSGKQSITSSKCSQNALKMLVFALNALLLLSRMYVEPQVHSACLICTCVQALIFWRFCICFEDWVALQSKTKIGPSKNF